MKNNKKIRMIDLVREAIKPGEFAAATQQAKAQAGAGATQGPTGRYISGLETLVKQAGQTATNINPQTVRRTMMDVMGQGSDTPPELSSPYSDVGDTMMPSDVAGLQDTGPSPDPEPISAPLAPTAGNTMTPQSLAGLAAPGPSADPNPWKNLSLTNKPSQPGSAYTPQPAQAAPPPHIDPMSYTGNGSNPNVGPPSLSSLAQQDTGQSPAQPLNLPPLPNIEPQPEDPALQGEVPPPSEPGPGLPPTMRQLARGGGQPAPGSTFAPGLGPAATQTGQSGWTPQGQGFKGKLQNIAAMPGQAFQKVVGAPGQVGQAAQQAWNPAFQPQKTGQNVKVPMRSHKEPVKLPTLKELLDLD